jgi:hypothetical protein
MQTNVIYIAAGALIAPKLYFGAALRSAINRELLESFASGYRL